MKSGILKGEYGVSLGTVREALSRLVADGLVVVEDQMGFRAAGVSQDDLEHVTTALIEIERALLRRSMMLGVETWEASIGVALEQLTSATTITGTSEEERLEIIERLEGRLLEAMLSAAESSWLMRFRNLLHEQMHRYRRISFAPARPLDARYIYQFRTLANAVIARDEYIALTLLEKLRSSASQAVRLSQPAQKTMPLSHA